MRVQCGAAVAGRHRAGGRSHAPRRGHKAARAQGGARDPRTGVPAGHMDVPPPWPGRMRPLRVWTGLWVSVVFFTFGNEVDSTPFPPSTPGTVMSPREPGYSSYRFISWKEVLQKVKRTQRKRAKSKTSPRTFKRCPPVVMAVGPRCSNRCIPLPLAWPLKCAIVHSTLCYDLHEQVSDVLTRRDDESVTRA